MDINSFLVGCVVQRDQDVGVFAVEPFGRPDVSMFHVLLGKTWRGYPAEPNWTTVGMAGALYPGADDLVIVASSSEGKTWELAPKTKAQRFGRICDGLSGVTTLATLGDEIWACGMDRIAFRREVTGDWTNQSAPTAIRAEGVIGFTAIALAEPGIPVAVGWRGEIWLKEERGWAKEDSGSSANFNAVSVGPDGEIVVVGDRGSLLVGRAGMWRVVDAKMQFNFQGVCHFESEIFVCTDFEIYRFVGGQLQRETRFADDDRPNTCMHLITGKFGVFSQGERDIFRFAGGVWTRIF